MTSIFRSEIMGMYRFIFQSDSLYQCVSNLADLSLVQFNDINANKSITSQRYLSEIKICQQIERKIDYVIKEIRKEDMMMLNEDSNNFIANVPSVRELMDIGQKILKYEEELVEINTNYNALQKSYIASTELLLVLRKLREILIQQPAEDDSEMKGRIDPDISVIPNDKSADGKQTPMSSTVYMRLRSDSRPFLRLECVPGVMSKARFNSFEIILWRSSRGNVLIKNFDIGKPVAGPPDETDYKVVFLIFFQGEQLKERIIKICGSMGASLYPFYKSQLERDVVEKELLIKVHDLGIIITHSKLQKVEILESVSKEVKLWLAQTLRAKIVFNALNLFNYEDKSHKFIIAEGWCPINCFDKVLETVTFLECQTASGTIINRIDPKSKMPPTLIKTNKYTEIFQSIVNAYGPPKYRELNPVPFTIVTFPFLFAVMFGDAGHGLIILLVGLVLINCGPGLKRYLLEEEMLKMFYQGRYLILLMGIFSIYTGLIYNDLFSKSINLFSSGWSIETQHVPWHGLNKSVVKGKKSKKDHLLKYDASHSLQSGHITLDPVIAYDQKESPYIGLDPIWHFAKNDITFSNSYKMKLSLVLGVSHMLFGIVLALMNHNLFKETLNIYCEFLPQLIFLLSTFGYLIILILSKWILVHSENSRCAPNLLLNLIHMFIFSYPSERRRGFKCPPFLFAGQKTLQIILMILALICVPWMLLSKPLIVRHRLKKVTKLSTNKVDKNSSGDVKKDDFIFGQDEPKVDVDKNNDDEGSDNELQFSDALIHQTIHTIEFCLECLSHTASYLRLWALSLAHAQLSHVLWEMVFRMGFKAANAHPIIAGLAIYVSFSAWATLTITILVLMEGLSAFLHALRLHWVEFQRKFYHGSGRLFTPLTFDNVKLNIDNLSVRNK